MRVDSVKEYTTTQHDTRTNNTNKTLDMDQQSEINISASSIGDKYFNEMIEKTNKKLALENTHLRLSVHDMSHQIVVKVVNTETEEVIREIPPEKFIDLVYNLCKQVGLILDERG